MPDIVLSTLNARYFHASLGLRYLYANLGELQDNAIILEYIINQRPQDIAEKLLIHAPKIIGFGIYIWNVEETTKIVSIIKKIRPDIHIVLGGPEVSYEQQEQIIVQLADYVISGWGDISFAKLCCDILINKKDSNKLIQGEQPPLQMLKLPYDFYTAEDIDNRLIYVEASRGCPYRCEFCLSSLDKTAWPFDISVFLSAMDKLISRGVKQFKFVDRTFNLNINISLMILDFFLERLDKKLFLHFEVIPDRLPEALKEKILLFPTGTLQFEIGIQTFNHDVQQRISRKQDELKTIDNLKWLVNNTSVHIHADLIIGLPGEDVASFAQGFNQLVSIKPHEIQVGILKRLRGTPIIRHSEAYGMIFSACPPYNVLCTEKIDYFTMQRLTRFARYWDLVGNSGRFFCTLPVLLGVMPFERFLKFSDWLYSVTNQTYQFNQDRLFEYVFRSLIEVFHIDQLTASQLLTEDYSKSGLRGNPSFLLKNEITIQQSESPNVVSTPARQKRHLRETI